MNQMSRNITSTKDISGSSIVPVGVGSIPGLIADDDEEMSMAGSDNLDPLRTDET